MALLEAEANAPQFTDPDFLLQSAFIDDPATHKVLFGSRRMGKSYALARYLLLVASLAPGNHCLYLALTRENAKTAIWQNALKPLVRQLNLKADFNESDLTVTLSNGSIISVKGAESNAAVKERLRGGKYALIVVDEAATFGPALRDLYFGILKPAVSDFEGTICLAGTPSNVHDGLFFDLTSAHDGTPQDRWTVKDAETGSEWSGHRWSTLDNPYMREQEQNQIDEMIRNNPAVVQTTLYKQERLGQWVVDSAKLVYAYAADKNTCLKLPNLHPDGWHTLLSIDLGWSDASAFLVGKYHDHDPCLYFLECYESPKMDFSMVAAKIIEYEKRYKFDKKIVDGANLQGVETIRRLHGLHLTPASKQEKWEHQQLMSADLIMSKIKLLPEARKLAHCFGKVIRDEKSDIPREAKSCHQWSHLTDCGLYMWRHAYNFMSKVPVIPPKPGTAEWYRQEEQRMQQPQNQSFVPDFDNY